MEATAFLRHTDAHFFAGVPDSLLRPVSDALMECFGVDYTHHAIAANEGLATALAAGHYLATGEPALVYLQNSGEGNLVNAVASLLHDKAYAIPVLFLIGWRGEPHIPDEPQHAYQGEITCALLDLLQIPYFILKKDTTEKTLADAMAHFRPLLAAGKPCAFLAQKGALTHEKRPYTNKNTLFREEAIRVLVESLPDAAFVSTTGKASRELYELRIARGESHAHDFLTIGSMGHSSSIALGIALAKPKQRVCIIDGDGAMLMHMGALPIIAAAAPKNLLHVVINNAAHESVGGMPTAAGTMDLPALALAVGYAKAVTTNAKGELRAALDEAKRRNGPVFIEVRAAIGARADLGRPTTTPKENKSAFMNYLRQKNHT